MPIIVLVHIVNSGMAFGLLSGTGIVRGGDSGLRFAAGHRADLAPQLTPQRVAQVLPRSQRGT